MPESAGAAVLDRIFCRVSTLDAIENECGGLAQMRLSPDEAKRRDTISHPNRRAQFLAGRWLTRQLLCEALGGTHSSWQITADASKKPSLVSRDDIHFSISHSKDLIACAIAPNRIGLDIEGIDATRDVGELAQMIDAIQSVDHNPGRNEAERFTVAWTLKEACMKRGGDAFDIGVMRGMRLALRPALDANVANWIDARGFALSLAADEVSLAHLSWVLSSQLSAVTYYRLASP